MPIEKNCVLSRESGRERNVLRLSAHVSRGGENVFSDICKKVLIWVEGRVGSFPPKAWDIESFELDKPGRPAEAVVLRGEGGSPDYWAIRLDDPDRSVAGRIWTTEVVVASVHNGVIIGLLQFVQLGENDSSSNIIPGVPKFIKNLFRTYECFCDGVRVSTRANEVNCEAEVDRLVELISHPNRRIPVFVVSLLGDGSSVVDSSQLAYATCGLAVVYVVSDAMTYLLSDRLGKRRSVWGGAVRLYQPGFSLEDYPYAHRVAARRTIETWEGGITGFVNTLVRNAAENSVEYVSDRIDVPRFFAVRSKKLDKSRINNKKSGVAESIQIADAEKMILSLQEEVKSNFDLACEEESKRKDAVRDYHDILGENYALRARIDALEADLGSQADAVDIPDDIECLGDWSAKYLAGKVVVAPRALRSAKGSQFRDVELIYKCLLFLGNEYRKNKRSKISKAIVDGKLQELGVDCSETFFGSGAGAFGDTYYIQHRGRRHLLKMHLKNRAATRDPARCLRIYFFWDEEEEQVVVGSLPGHLENRLS